MIGRINYWTIMFCKSQVIVHYIMHISNVINCDDGIIQLANHGEQYVHQEASWIVAVVYKPGRLVLKDTER